MKRVWIPIRFKILVAVLVLISTVVSLITFTMANLFHADKTAYIHDLTSMIAQHTAQEAHSLLVGYRERVQVFAHLLGDRKLTRDEKVRLAQQLFQDFEEIIAIAYREEGAEEVALYDVGALAAAGLNQEDLVRHREAHPLPVEQIRKGKVFVENTTLSAQLPALTLASVVPALDDSQAMPVAVAVVRLAGLLRLASRSQVFETFLTDSEGVLLAHPDPQLVTSRATADWIPSFNTLASGHSLATTREYAQGGDQKVGGFAPVEVGGLLAGVQIPRSAAYLTARDLLDNLMGASLAVLALSALFSLFWSRRLTKPIERLSAATRVVATGDFDTQLTRSSRDEIGDLSQSFNQMAAGLKSREAELQKAHAALVQSEKMSAFGQLSAGIAHEVKNPLAGILGYAQLSLRKVDAGDPLHKNLGLIEKETKRCKTIIDNLMKFARQEKAVTEPTDLLRVVEDATAIVDHQLTINRVKLHRELPPGLPKVMANGNQIQQVLMNLMINAQQAMDGNPGEVTVSARQLDARQVEVRVADTGPGMSEEVRAKIFEPFYTTKRAGKGTGLGLSVSYGIIREHRGEIQVESHPGQGATFIVTLPVASEGRR